MEFSESLLIGIKSVQQHKLRSLLTTLGVIFGVAAVIAMMSIGEGARRTAIEQIRLLGTNNIRVRNAVLTGEQAEEADYKQTYGVTINDARHIAKVLTTVNGVAPIKFVEAQVRFEDKTSGARVVGTTVSYQNVTNFRPAKGRFLVDLDVARAKRVCVIGHEVAEELFDFREPVGQRIQMDNSWYTVVGVMEPKNIQSGKAAVIELRDLNKDIYIPISTALKRFTDLDRPDRIDELAIQVMRSDLVVPTSAIVDRILARTHKDVPDYEIVVPAELLAQSQRTQRVFNIVMGSIAAISLLVGGIGIMNIMLASVTERTKEIGTRRALGASERDILGQFLNETLLISASGGLIGIVIGAMMAKGINVFANWETVISVISVIVAFGISAMVGIVFGIYPARKAARMDPIAALRFE